MDNIEIVYSIVADKLRVVHLEYDITNFSPIDRTTIPILDKTKTVVMITLGLLQMTVT